MAVVILKASKYTKADRLEFGEMRLGRQGSRVDNS